MLSVWLFIVSLSGAGPAFAQDSGDAANQASPANGHAAVIAQGVGALPADSVRWHVARQPLDPAAALELVGPGFVIADKAPVLVRSGSGTTERLAVGEAAFVHADGATVSALGDETTSIKTMLVADAEASNGQGLFSGEEFDAPTGQRDIDLVRDVLKTTESTRVDNADTPALILALKGTVTVENEDGDTVVVSAAKARELSGSLTVTATSTGSAVVVVAVIGAGIPEDGSISPLEPTAVASETAQAIVFPGSIDLEIYLCDPGVSVPAATPVTCDLRGSSNDGEYSLSGGTLTAPVDATFAGGGTWTWSSVAPGTYTVSVDRYPQGYVSFAIDSGPGLSHVGDTVTAPVGNGQNQSINIYFFVDNVGENPTGESMLGLTFYDCPAGTTVEEIENWFDPVCATADAPFLVMLSGGSLSAPIRFDQLQTVPAEYLVGDYAWLDLPGGSYTISVAPLVDGDTYYWVRQCGDASCPVLDVFSASVGVDLQDDGGLGISIYRIPSE